MIVDVQIHTTLGELAAAEPALERLAALPLPIKPAYHLTKLARLVRQELGSYHDIRNRHARELGTSDDGRLFNFTRENGQIFNEKIAVLNAEPVTIPWSPIILDSWGDVLVAPGDLAALGSLLGESFARNGDGT